MNAPAGMRTNSSFKPPPKSTGRELFGAEDLERRLAELEADALQAGAPLLKFAWCNGLSGNEQIMQPAWTGEAGFIGGVEHTVGIAQQLLGMFSR